MSVTRKLLSPINQWSTSIVNDDHNFDHNHDHNHDHKRTFTTTNTSPRKQVQYQNHILRYRPKAHSPLESQAHDRNWYISPVHHHEPMIITTVSTTAMTTSTTTVVITSASTSSVNEAKCSSSSFEKRDLCFEDNRSHNYSLENIFSEKLSFVASHINERPTFFCQNLQLHSITRRFLSLYLLLDF